MYTINVIGVQQVARSLERGAVAVLSLRPALWTVREDMFRVIRATFTGQGRRFGGSWKALDPKTVEQKARKGLDPRILIARGRLMRSLTERGNAYMRSNVTRDTINLTTTVPYAEAQQYGTEDGHIPARPFIDFDARDRDRWNRIVLDHVMSAVRGV